MSREKNALTADRVQDEPRIYVESEDQPDRMLLETRIVKDDGYQKQQGTSAASVGGEPRWLTRNRHTHCVDRDEWH